MIQYVTTSSIPQNVKDYILDRVGVFDEYVCFYTSDNRIEAYVGTVGADSRHFVFNRSSSGYNYYWTVSEETSNFTYSISEPLYAYGNVPDCNSFRDSNHHLVIIGAFLVVLTLVIIWKGGIFRSWRRQRLLRWSS